MLTMTMVAAVTVTKIMALTAMVGGTDNNQLKVAAELMGAAAMTGMVMERAMVTATKGC